AGSHSADASRSARRSPCAPADSPRFGDSPGNGSTAPALAPGTTPTLLPSLLLRSSLPPAAWSTGLPFFCVHFFQDLVLNRQVRHQPFEPRVLFLQCSHPLGLA